MSQSASETINSSIKRQYLKDYQSPNFRVESISLNFDIQNEFTLVTNKMLVTRLKPGSAELNGVDLKLLKISIDGRALSNTDFILNSDSLTLPESLLASGGSHEIEIITQLDPVHNTSLEGLYVSSGCLVTQCEAQGFRKITYYFDRPDVMTRFTVSIEADKTKYPILLSNGDRISVADIGHNRHRALWKDPHKKPCYLFALFAGDLGLIRDEFVTRSGRKVNLEIYAAHGKQQRCNHAMASLKKSMKWDEDTYGLEYDLNDYMIVAIDDFNAGAMENKGLNIFNSRLVLADEASATDQDYHNIESVVAHEYFHNWTGNRVTLRDWFQLSLKEGLTVFRDQEFSADMTDARVQRINDVDHLRAGQFAEDAGPSSHPVRPESCLAVDNFFTMTIYEKGAEVIRMMQNTVGKKGFKLGMKTYFQRHDGQAVTCDDFAAAIFNPNGLDETQFKLWYSQAGTPTLKVTEQFDASQKVYTLKLSQECPIKSGEKEKLPFHIPIIIGLLTRSGQQVDLSGFSFLRKNTDGQFLIDLKTKDLELKFAGFEQKPVPSFLREFSAPVHLDWNASDEDLQILARFDVDGFNRREAFQKLVRQNLMSYYHSMKGQEAKPNLSLTLSLIKEILIDKNLDDSYKALMLKLPSEAEMIQSLADSDFNPVALLDSRTAFLKAIATDLRSLFAEEYQRLNSYSLKGLEAKQISARELKAQYLYFLSLLSSEYQQWAADLYDQTQTMTDKMTALSILSATQSSLSDVYLEKFYQEWKDDGLVINKWLSLQAATRQISTFDRVKTLMNHPAFNIKNPNNVYSLLRTFGANSAIFFHPEVLAMNFYAEQILKIDKLNPQVAARLCAAFNIYKKLEPNTRQQLQKAVDHLLAQADLSKNTRELLEGIK